jgi:hypothetical protein
VAGNLDELYSCFSVLWEIKLEDNEIGLFNFTFPGQSVWDVICLPDHLLKHNYENGEMT